MEYIECQLQELETKDRHEPLATEFSIQVLEASRPGAFTNGWAGALCWKLEQRFTVWIWNTYPA